MKRACKTFRAGLAAGRSTSDHAAHCSSCRAAASGLARVESLLRESGVPQLPSGFAASAARAAIAEPPDKHWGFVERFVPVALPAALASAICAALLFAFGGSDIDRSADEDADPAAAVTEVSTLVIGHTESILGDAE